MSVISSSNSGLSTATSTFVTTGKVQNVALPTAHTEVSHTLPAYTKRFELKLRGPTTAILKLSYDAGTSGTTYRTINPGSFYAEDQIGSASTTLYLQATAAAQVVEITSWV